jgi:hypothetical protein
VVLSTAGDSTTSRHPVGHGAAPRGWALATRR